MDNTWVVYCIGDFTEVMRQHSPYIASVALKQVTVRSVVSDLAAVFYRAELKLNS